jgi:hypothetical protein
MKTLIIVLFLLGISLFSFSFFGPPDWARSADSREDDAYLSILGSVILIVDFLIFMGWQLFKS